LPGPFGESEKQMRTNQSGLLNPHQIDALKDAIEKGVYDPSYVSSISGLGPVEQFEEAFPEAAGGKYALALSSCTAALHTALMALGIGPGDEVIVTPYTWGQSVAPVLFTGATAVFADIEAKTLTIDPKSVENRISKKTKAIIPVHIFGNPADMDALCSIAEKHRLAVIADAAQAFGALSKGRKIGSLGDAACFSLGRGKAVCGGEGGVLVTNSVNLYNRAVALTQHPLRAFREIVDECGTSFLDELNWNYRIHPLAAILGLADLKIADKRVAHRKRILNIVHQELKSTLGIKSIICYSGDSSAACGIPLTYDSEELRGIPRESLIEHLHSKSDMIQPGPVRRPIHLRSTFQCNNKSLHRVGPHHTHRKGSCLVAENRCELHELLLFDVCTLDNIEVRFVFKMIQVLKRKITEI
jgi:perosamine synthetase